MRMTPQRLTPDDAARRGRPSTRTGWCPVIAQEARTGQVRMFAWANREALELTLATGGGALLEPLARRRCGARARARATRWPCASVRIDCDGDVVLYRVDADGPSCHTGATSCFYRARRRRTARSSTDDGPPDPPAVIVARVADVIASAGASARRSRTWSRCSTPGFAKINGKIAEEARRARRGAARGRRRATPRTRRPI